jgi:hypothetical protein
MLRLVDITAALAEKDPPITQPGIPVGAATTGMLSNACGTVAYGPLLVTGDLSGTLTIDNPGSIGPASLQLTAWASGLPGFYWTVTVPQGAAPGVHRAQLNVRRNGNIVGRFVLTMPIMDLAAEQVEDLQGVPLVLGIRDYLQVAEDDFVKVSP